MDWQTNCKDKKRQRGLVIGKNENRLIEKRDLVHVAVLLAIGLAIGVYLIATTVLIAKDGVFYIERAQQFASNPIKIIKAHPPGHPFLIFVAHKFISLFSNSSSVQGWIYSAQGVTLLCRLLALIPLYLIGKLLVGGKNSFWALLILIFLPYPARIVCDVVREWPYLLFLATGFFFLLWGAKYDKWWALGFVGLSAGLGYLIRPESAQLVVYGFLWAAISMFRSKLWDVSRWKALVGLTLLIIGFAIPAVPYMKCTGKIVPPKIYHIMQSFSFDSLTDKTDIPTANAANSKYYTAKIAPDYILKAFDEIFKTTGENLMWFFVPMLLIGFWYHFQRNAEYEERFLITAFITTNVVIIILRYYYIQLHVSQRWSLPLITFTIFYIPVGLGIVGNWLDNRFPMNKQKSDISRKKRCIWFLVLLLVGICICLPKLFRSIRIEKQRYKETAEWLRKNTTPKDIIAGPDRRISFYAERKGVLFAGDRLPGSCKYAIRQFQGQDEMFLYGMKMKEKLSLVKNWRNEKTAFVAVRPNITKLVTRVAVA